MLSVKPLGGDADYGEGLVDEGARAVCFISLAVWLAGFK
jgi:hypothetical protein